MSICSFTHAGQHITSLATPPNSPSDRNALLRVNQRTAFWTPHCQFGMDKNTILEQAKKLIQTDVNLPLMSKGFIEIDGLLGVIISNYFQTVHYIISRTKSDQISLKFYYWHTTIPLRSTHIAWTKSNH